MVKHWLVNVKQTTSVERAVVLKTFFIFSWKVNYPLRPCPFLSVLFCPYTSIYSSIYPSSIECLKWPAQCYGTNTLTAPWSYFKNCCMCFFIAVTVGSEFLCLLWFCRRWNLPQLYLCLALLSQARMSVCRWNRWRHYSWVGLMLYWSVKSTCGVARVLVTTRTRVPWRKQWSVKKGLCCVYLLSAGTWLPAACNVREDEDSSVFVHFSVFLTCRASGDCCTRPSQSRSFRPAHTSNYIQYVV